MPLHGRAGPNCTIWETVGLRLDTRKMWKARRADVSQGSRAIRFALSSLIVWGRVNLQVGTKDSEAARFIPGPETNLSTCISGTFEATISSSLRPVLHCVCWCIVCRLESLERKH